MDFLITLVIQRPRPADTEIRCTGNKIYDQDDSAESERTGYGTAWIPESQRPVGVVDAIGTTYEESKSEGTLMLWMNMLNMAVLLSANLGVMNLLPLPALDGGRLVFLIIEAIRKKPINREIEGRIHFAGLMALMVLMVVVMYNDILKIF